MNESGHYNPQGRDGRARGRGRGRGRGSRRPGSNQVGAMSTTASSRPSGAGNAQANFPVPNANIEMPSSRPGQRGHISQTGPIVFGDFQSSDPRSAQTSSGVNPAEPPAEPNAPEPKASEALSPGSQLSFQDQMRNMLLRDRHPQDAASSATGTSEGPSDVSRSDKKSQPRKRLTQAERRQGHSNRLDLSETNPSSHNSVSRSSGSYDFSQGSSQASAPWEPSALEFSHQQVSAFNNQRASWTPVHHYQNPAPRNINYPVEDLEPRISRQYARGYSVGESNAYPHSRSQGPVFQQAQLQQRPTNYRQNFGSTEIPNRPSALNARVLYEPNRGEKVDLLPPSRQAIFLDSLADRCVAHMGISLHEETQFSSLRFRIHNVIINSLKSDENTQNIPEESVKLECFGSLASGFAMAKSDMDLMLFYDGTSLTEQQSLCIPRLVEKALLDEAHGARLLTRTRVPIIRFCSSPSKELLEALRIEREKWEDEEQIKKAAEEKDSEEGGDLGDELSTKQKRPKIGNAADPPSLMSPNSGKETPSRETLEVVKSANVQEKDLSTGSKVSEANEQQEPQKPGPPPYRNDEERINLYRLAIKEDWYTISERRLISNYAAAFTEAGGDPNNDYLISTRAALDSLPDVLCRYREPRKRKQELEFPEQSGLLCDINFSTGQHANPLGVHNTRMLRCYSLCDPRIKEMVIFVKGWAKARKINKPYYGTLSSYGYVLMVLHYVVNVASPPLAPNLQLVHLRNAATQYPAPETCGEYDIRFWQDPDAIVRASRSEFGLNAQSVGSLLAGFFRYYAVHDYRGQRGFEWMKDVLSLRTPGGLLTKQDKGWTGKWTQTSETEPDASKPREITHRYLIAIEDPFEHSHNVGRPVMHHGIVAIRDEFRRANQIIVGGGVWNGQPLDFFEEGVEHEREHLYFGPNPKHKKEKAPPTFGPKNLTGEERAKALEKAVKAQSAEKTKEAAPQRGKASVVGAQVGKTPLRPHSKSKDAKKTKLREKQPPASKSVLSAKMKRPSDDLLELMPW